MFKKVSCHMRKLALLTAVAAMAVGLAGTANAEPLVVDLEAGNSGGFMVGTVTVDNDADNLTVVYEIPTESFWWTPPPKSRGNQEAGEVVVVVWEFLETHLAVDPDSDTCDNVPQTRKGNVKTGWFPYATSYDPGSGVTVVPYTIPLPEGTETGDVLCIAAHALVAMVGLDEFGDPIVINSESAWGIGTEFENDRNWSMHFTYIGHDHGT